MQVFSPSKEKTGFGCSELRHYQFNMKTDKTKAAKQRKTLPKK